MKFLVPLLCVFTLISSQSAFANEPSEAALIQNYNSTIGALFSGNGNLSAEKSKLEKTFAGFDPDNYSEAYLKSESLIDRLDRMEKVQQGLNACNLKKCDPKDVHCVDLKIDEQIKNNSKTISYCEGSKPMSPTVANDLSVVITAMKTESSKLNDKLRSKSCVLAKDAETEFLLNRVKTLMRVMKRYHTSLLPGEPTDAQILNKAVGMILKCGSNPTSFCSATKTYLEQKGDAFLKDKVHGLGSVTREKNQKVAENLNRNFRGLNIAYLDSEGTRSEKCASSGYAFDTEKILKQQYAALVSLREKLISLYSKVDKNKAAALEYQKLTSQYKKQLNEYESYEKTKLGNFKKYNALCTIRAERNYGYGGTSNGHVWGDRRNLINPSAIENAEEQANYKRLKNDFTADYLKLMQTQDGVLIASEAIGVKKGAFKTLGDGPQPAGPIDENVSASDVAKAVEESIGMIKDDVAEMQDKFPFNESTAKLSGCEDHLKILAEKDPMALSKAAMDHPEATSALCGPIKDANSTAQFRETSRRVVRVGTYVAIGAGLVMTGGAFAGAAPGLLLVAADTGLNIALTAGSAYNYTVSKEEMRNADLLFLSGNGDPLNVVESTSNFHESRSNLKQNAIGIAFRTIGFGVNSATKYKNSFDASMSEVFEAGLIDGTAAYKGKTAVNTADEIETWMFGISKNSQKLQTWTEFEKVAKSKISEEQFSSIVNEGLIAHKTGIAADQLNDVPANMEKMRALVKFKSKLRTYGFSQEEAQLWTKKLADQKILGTELSGEVSEESLNALRMMDSEEWVKIARKYRMLKKGDPTIFLKDHEQAVKFAYRFPALEEFGFGLPNKMEWTKVTSRMENSVLYGESIGWEKKLENGYWARVRLDYNPKIGAHYNIEMTVKSEFTGNMETLKLAIRFDCPDKACNGAQILKIAKKLSH